MWVAIDVGPMRETCSRFRDEVVVAFVLNALTFSFGVCCSWLCGRFLLVAVSALATVSLSRVTLFAYDVKTICAAGIASAPQGDILTDVTVLDRVQFVSWVALVFFAVGLLTAHLSSDILGWFNFPTSYAQGESPRRRHYNKEYRRPCRDEEENNNPAPRRKTTTWLHIPY